MRASKDRKAENFQIMSRVRFDWRQSFSVHDQIADGFPVVLALQDLTPHPNPFSTCINWATNFEALLDI